MIYSIEKAKLDNKTALIRVDFNVPISNGRVIDRSKIRSAIPTIRHALSGGANIILVSHLGDPKLPLEDPDNFSLEPLVPVIEEELGTRVKFTNIGDLKHNIGNEKIVLIENIRFHPGEKQACKDFAYTLSAFADLYVNEAFSCCHRDHASITILPSMLPSFAGIDLLNEVNTLTQIFNNLVEPVILIMGGGKVATKFKFIKQLSHRKNLKAICLGGIIANSVLNAMGYEIGKSLFTDLPKGYDQLIELPQDVHTSTNLCGSDSHMCAVENVPKNELILDLGPATIMKYMDLIEKAGTVIWNGPLGYCESAKFRNATEKIASHISNLGKHRGLISLIGGGDTIGCLDRREDLNLSHISVGGGALLSWFSNTDMVGLKALHR